MKPRFAGFTTNAVESSVLTALRPSAGSRTG
jgi:hypothetical protein